MSGLVPDPLAAVQKPAEPGSVARRETLDFREQIAAAPIELNARLGCYTNFVNLLDYCALAVPAGLRADGLPAGPLLWTRRPVKSG